jgi:hypothetical protein
MPYRWPDTFSILKGKDPHHVAFSRSFEVVKKLYRKFHALFQAFLPGKPHKYYGKAFVQYFFNLFTAFLS